MLRNRRSITLFIIWWPHTGHDIDNAHIHSSSQRKFMHCNCLFLALYNKVGLIVGPILVSASIQRWQPLKEHVTSSTVSQCNVSLFDELKNVSTIFPYNVAPPLTFRGSASLSSNASAWMNVSQKCLLLYVFWWLCVCQLRSQVENFHFLSSS